MRRRLALGAVVGAAAAAGCSAVLGMDAPTLDPCAQGGCVDAVGVDAETGGGADTAVAVDAPADGDALTDGPHEAACVDVGIPDSGPAGIRCGGGCYPMVYCTGSTPVCCESTDDAGTTTFACTATETACGGYAIKCLNENDCGGSDVCCHFSTHTVCDSTCPNADLACIPGSVDDCPAGKACDVTLVNAGVPSPYFGCAP